MHWDWLCLAFSFRGRQNHERAEREKERGRERDNLILTSSVLRAHQAGSNSVCAFMCAVCLCVCVCVCCLSLSTLLRWCVRSVGVCATHWTGRRVRGGMEAGRWMLCHELWWNAPSPVCGVCVCVCGGVYEWAVHRLVSDPEPVWIGYRPRFICSHGSGRARRISVVLFLLSSFLHIGEIV